MHGVWVLALARQILERRVRAVEKKGEQTAHARVDNHCQVGVKRQSCDLVVIHYQSIKQEQRSTTISLISERGDRCSKCT